METVLIPVDGSNESTHAVEFGAAIAAAYDASLHVVYVVGDHLTGPLDHQPAAQSVGVPETTFIDTIDNIAREHTVTVTHSTAIGFSTKRKLTHPGSVILDTAEQIGADFIVIPRDHHPTEDGELLEKAAEYVLMYASQPVLSV